MKNLTLTVNRFVGISITGAKNERSAVVTLEYYPKHKKIFISEIKDSWDHHEEVSTDQVLFEYLKSIKSIKSAMVDAPLDLPKCMRCKLKCPGYEKCKEQEIHWMWKSYRKLKKQKKHARIFTPYTERCVEYYLANELEEPFHANQALGSNFAPLLARTYFLQRRLHWPLKEFHPKITLWRVGNMLKVSKSHLRFHKHSVGGDESRLAVLNAIIEANITFIYQQDLQKLVQNVYAFDAFLGAITAYLDFKGQTEKKPVGFPRKEAWISYPLEKVVWFK